MNRRSPRPFDLFFLIARVCATIFLLSQCSNSSIAVDLRYEIPPELVGFDATSLVNIQSASEADATRQALVQFLWPSGLPTGKLPNVTTVYDGTGSTLPNDLVDGTRNSIDVNLVNRVDKLEIVSPSTRITPIPLFPIQTRSRLSS